VRDGESVTFRDLVWALVLLVLWPALWFIIFGSGVPLWLKLAALAAVPFAVGFTAGRRWAGWVVLASVALVLPVALATSGVYEPDSGDTSLGEGLLFIAIIYGLPAAALVQLGVVLRLRTQRLPPH
jgi:hypothetical protein